MRNNNTQLDLKIKRKWEREGNLVLNEKDWEHLCKIRWKTSNLTLCREFYWKNLIRFFITPAQKRNYTNSSVCWRQCGCLKANHFHRFWSVQYHPLSGRRSIKLCVKYSRQTFHLSLFLYTEEFYQQKMLLLGTNIYFRF